MTGEMLRVRQPDIRPPMQQWKDEIAEGKKSPYEAVESILSFDAQRVQGIRSVRGLGDGRVKEENEAIAALYGLPTQDRLPLAFVQGFMFVATTLYPSVVEVARRNGIGVPGEDAPQVVYEPTRDESVEQSPTTPEQRAELAALLRIRSESSGRTWLEKYVKAKFKDEELKGALSAVRGAVSLYEELSTPQEA